MHWAVALIAMASSLSTDEQALVENWLTGMTLLLLVLVLALVSFALIVSRTAKHSTQPCRWCMEFIPKKATVCPRCGKALMPEADLGRTQK